MSDWRTLGYVPDSDDEDDFSNLIQHQRRDEAGLVNDRLVEAASPDTKHKLQPKRSFNTLSIDATSESTASQLERTLSQGLQTVRDILAVATPSNDHHDDIDDSPLSSPPESLAASPSPPTHLNLGIGPVQNEHEDEVLQLQLHDFAQDAPRRSLRARAPIQEHPYMLEDARYRQLMKGVGIKPVNVPTAVRSAEVANKDEESQQSEPFESYQPDESFDFQVPSSPLSLQSLPEDTDQQPETFVADNMTLSDVENDLPDLTQILRERDRTAKQRRRGKERSSRNANGSSLVLLGSAKDSGVPADPSNNEVSHDLPSRNHSFQIPPSPPRSDDHLVFEDNTHGEIRPQTRLSSGLNTPRALPTPLISSDGYSRKRPVAVVSSSESSLSTDEDSDSEIVPQSEKDDSQGILSIKQKLKGSLPASWVRIDMQNQGTARLKQRTIPQSVATSNERGVARKISTGRYRRTEHVAGGGFPISSAETSDSDDAVRTTSRDQLNEPSSMVRADVDAGRALPGEPVEDDEIDYMLPQSSRRSAGVRRQHQKRIHDGWAVLSRRSVADASATALASRNHGDTGASNKNRSTSAKRKKSKHRSVPPAMSISDAPGIRDLDRKDQPQFLKLAARHARTVNHQSQRFVPRKVFVLATKDDTQDVNDQIIAWQHRRNTGTQQGFVAGAPVSSNTTIHAADLSRTLDSISTATRSNPQLEPAEGLEFLKRSTRALLTTASGRNSNQSNAPAATNRGGLVESVAQDQNSSGSIHLRSLFAHRNRSGHGQLISRAPEPRAAQIESSRAPGLPRTNLPIRNVVTLKRQPQTGLPNLPEKVRADSKDTVPRKKSGTRQLRKQAPQMSTIPTARMEHENRFDIPGLQNYSTDLEPREETIRGQKQTIDSSTHWAQAAIYAVQSLEQLHSFTEFGNGGLISDGVLDEVSRFKYDADFDAPQVVQQCPIYTPVSHQWINCTRYGTTMEEAISVALDEVQLVLFTVNNTPCSLDDYQKCIKSINTVVDYVAGELRFFNMNLETKRSCARFLLERMGHFLAGFSSQDLLADDQRRSAVLRCLNWLAILLMNIYCRYKGSPLLENETRDMCHRVIGRSFEIVFEPQQLNRALKDLRSPRGRGKIEESFIEAETVVIAWHSCRMFSKKGDDQLFYDTIKSALARVAPLDWVDHLALTLLALCLVLPFKHVLANGSKGYSSDFLDPSGSLFNLLASHLSSIIAQVPSECVTLHGGQLLEAVEDLCLKAVRKWHLVITSTMVTCLLQTYAWNAMLPFSTTPDVKEMFHDHDCLLKTHHLCQKNDFCKFLELVEVRINRSCGYGYDNNEVVTANRVRGLVFSLLPNNARIVDAREQLEVTQFLALKNHFALYITLFTKAPDGFQPRIEQLQRQVDFSNSHALICQLAITTWKAIALDYVQRPDLGHGTLEAFSKWMNMMLRQSIVCLEEHQQFSAISLIEDLLSTLTAVISCCDSEIKARHLLIGDTFGTIAELLSRTDIHRNNERIITAGLKMLYAYANTLATSHTKETMINEVQLVLKKVIQRTLSNIGVSNEDLIRHLMAAWFVVAQNMVRSFHRHWNDFVEPHSNLSIDFLSGLRNSYAAYEAKQCFYSDLIKADPSFFFLEARPVVFMTWVATLLLPVQSMRFEHFLTNSILKYERDSLMIKDLAALLFEHDNSRELTLQDVVDSRIVILRHIIQNIYGQQNDPEEEWLAGGLDTAAQKDLLRTMTKAMKANWLDLKDMPVAQADYTALVHAILNEMETYPITGFKIDSWFSGASEFPRPVQTLDNIFKCRYGETRNDITKEAIRNFKLVYIQEIEGQRDDRMLQELIRVFHCTDPLRARKIDGRTQYSIDMVKQAKFMQIIFPAFIERGSKEYGSRVMKTMLDLITQLAERIPFRIDNLNADHMRHYVKTTAALLCAVRKALEVTQMAHRYDFAMIRYMRMAIASVLFLDEAGIEIEETDLEMCVRNVLGIYEALQVALKHRLGFPILTTPVKKPSEDGPFADQDTVYDRWTTAPVESLQLVPEKLSWLLRYDATEPELSEEEQGLREFAREELKGWEGLEEKGEWTVPKFKEEVMGLIRDLKGRDLVCEDDNEDSDMDNFEEDVGYDDEDEDETVDEDEAEDDEDEDEDEDGYDNEDEEY